mmetsp:Transcript_13902/g.28466  ORF Transcript_13902/g.28466 Transcript_13902/m.28466 type:complete len:109 (-) Transcript_13902:13-339(-)
MVILVRNLKEESQFDNVELRLFSSLKMLWQESTPARRDFYNEDENSRFLENTISFVDETRSSRKYSSTGPRIHACFTQTIKLDALFGHMEPFGRIPEPFLKRPENNPE